MREAHKQPKAIHSQQRTSASTKNWLWLMASHLSLHKRTFSPRYVPNLSSIIKMAPVRVALWLWSCKQTNLRKIHKIDCSDSSKIVSNLMTYIAIVKAAIVMVDRLQSVVADWIPKRVDMDSRLMDTHLVSKESLKMVKEAAWESRASSLTQIKTQHRQPCCTRLITRKTGN